MGTCDGWVISMGGAPSRVQPKDSVFQQAPDSTEQSSARGQTQRPVLAEFALSGCSLSMGVANRHGTSKGTAHQRMLPTGMVPQWALSTGQGTSTGATHGHGTTTSTNLTSLQAWA